MRLVKRERNMGGPFLATGKVAALVSTCDLDSGNTGVSQGSFPVYRRLEWLGSLMFFGGEEESLGCSVCVRNSKHEEVKGREIPTGLFKLESNSRKDRFLIPLPNINTSFFVCFLIDRMID